MRKLVIIPAYNEAESIKNVIENLTKNYPQYDYIIVNDGSKDKTLEVCLNNHYNVLNLPINLGIGGAVQCGYRYALKYDYDIAIQMDGDGQHDPQYLDEITAIIERGEAEVVVGSRFIEKEGFQSSVSRRLGISILSVWGKFLTGFRLKDITSGYRAVNKDLIKIFAEDYPADFPEPEAMIMASINGFTIMEYPVVMHERSNGISSINLRKSIYYMVKVSIAMLIRRISLGFRR